MSSSESVNEKGKLTMPPVPKVGSRAPATGTSRGSSASACGRKLGARGGAACWARRVRRGGAALRGRGTQLGCDMANLPKWLEMGEGQRAKGKRWGDGRWAVD